MKRFLCSLMFAASLVLASPLALASAGAGQGAKIERLLDAMVEMMPFGQVFDMLASQDPTWPLTGAADRVDAGALACLRGELSSAGYRRYQLPLVTAYAVNNPDRVDKDLALLEGGGAALFGKLVIAGAEGERTGVEVNPEVVLADATPEQLTAFMEVFSDPGAAGLRELAGFGEALDLDKSEAENEAAGEKVGGDLAGMLLQRALRTCRVDPQLLK
ncbi:MAG TPA: hypothetical protein PLG89_11740 [Arenimonas sp.]|nr:hypothetical protein [Arenimonas sp.]